MYTSLRNSVSVCFAHISACLTVSPTSYYKKKTTKPKYKVRLFYNFYLVSRTEKLPCKSDAVEGNCTPTLPLEKTKQNQTSQKVTDLLVNPSIIALAF